MASHSSATARPETLHVNQAPTHGNQTNQTSTNIAAIRRRAKAVLNDTSIDPQCRAIIRYGLEGNDPWLAELVRRVDAGENIAEAFDFSQSLEPRNREANERDSCEHSSSEEKIAALAEIICRAGDESTAALLVLMGTVENSTHPKVLANAAKHFAFTRCGELNLYGMVDAQIAVVERELWST